MEKGQEETKNLIYLEEERNRREDMDDDMEWMLELGEKIMVEEARLKVVNDIRVRQVELAEEILKQIVIGDEVRIEKKIFDPFPSMGCISVIGEVFEIDDMVEFAKVASLASNIDFCVKTDQTLEMDLTFHGLAYNR